MCLCMLMHAAMNHDAHQHPAPAANAASVGTRKCAHCDFPLQMNFAFCPNCGMKHQERQCGACGQAVDATWKACAYCGSPLGETAEEASPA